MKRYIFCAVIFLCSSFIFCQNKKNLTLEDIYHPKEKINFSGHVPFLEWLSNNEYLEWKYDSKTDETILYRVNLESGISQPFYDVSKMIEVFSLLPGLDKDKAQKIVFGSHTFNNDKTALITNSFNDLFYYSLKEQQAVRLTHSAQDEKEAHFSPDGKFVSFVQDNDIYIVDIAAQKVRSLTSGGSQKIFNGYLDWVYQEEIYGRGNFKGYWWSPDAKKIAYLQLDESQVDTFTVVDHIPYKLNLEVTSYPKAGNPNPKVRLGIIDVVGGNTTWVDTFKYESNEFLIVEVGWLPNSSKLFYKLQNREQTWLDFNVANMEGKSETILRETSSAWVRVNEPPIWLNNNEFLWLSDRSGHKHFYHYDLSGELKTQITLGEWEVKDVYGYNFLDKIIYFSANKAKAVENNVYSVKLNGEDLIQISSTHSDHSAYFSPDYLHYIDYSSTVNTPRQLNLYNRYGQKIKTIAENIVPELEEYSWGATEFYQVKTRDGFEMEAMMIKPPQFDPQKKYPVLCYTYSGPNAPSVHNAWRGTQYLWHQFLAQKGYIIWICDNRTASGKGMKYTWQVYRNFGELELRDLEDGLSWLKQQSFVDSERIGIWGWSYGGYMTCYALAHSKSFKIGIAGAPVTDWRDYDTIYTERYMGTPQNNEEGYVKSSPVHNAHNLNGHLLLIHGTMDDNVHLQNSIQFVYELQKANKHFSLMLYPRSRHGVRNAWQRLHLYQLMTNFVLNNL